MDAAGPRVDAYIHALPGWHQAICREFCDLAHAADGLVTDRSITRPRQPGAPGCPGRSRTTRSPP
jgi:hypothetical protein